MKFKLFASRTRSGLEEQINQWLEENLVVLESMRFKYCATPLEDPDVHIIEYSIVLFYVPLYAL